MGLEAINKITNVYLSVTYQMFLSIPMFLIFYFILGVFIGRKSYKPITHLINSNLLKEVDE